MSPTNLFNQNNFGKLFASILFCLVAVNALFAQQGSLDTSFGTNNTGIYQDPLPDINDPTNIARRFGPIELLANGQAVFAGNYTKNLGGGNFVNGVVLRRLNANGSADPSFANGTGTVETNFFTVNGSETNMLQPVMAVQPADGKIVLAAQCNVNFAPNPNDNYLGSDLCIMRFNANGTLDTSFGGNTVQAWGGNGNFPPTTYTMPGGKVWTYTGTNEVFPTTNGGFNGIPVRIRIATDGRIIVFGNSRDFIAPNQTGRFKGFIAVYSTNGTLQTLTSLYDTTGNTNDGFGVTRINDGGILSNGDFFSVGSQARLVSSNPAVFTNSKWKVWRNTTGSFLDQVNNNLAENAFSFTELRSNKILVGGGAAGAGATFVRYNGDLSIDTTFGTNGRVVPTCNGSYCIGGSYVGSLLNQSDGKIIGFGDTGGLYRINPDGSPDRSFARNREDVVDNLGTRGILPSGRYLTPFATRGGTDTHIYHTGFAIRPNGRIILAGVGGTSGFVAQADVLQLNTFLRNGGTFSDFNNDGKVELAVFRPSDGVWHTLDSFTGGYTPVQWGVSTDKLAPADYDGDGKTDLAVFRNGIWYILQSSNGQVRYAQWGSAGDLPRPGDFNGDGIADIAVFRPSDGNWYILYSNPIQPGNITYRIINFGQNGDIPLMGDFDGDGKSDVSVFRNGTWYYLRSTNQSTGIVQFGLAGDVPVAGDYDADGKTDFAVFRNGTWYVLRSSDNGVTILNWGLAGDKPVPGDYDNDGKNDIAIYRNGAWWILRSSDNGYSVGNFGVGTDIPIPYAYLQ